MHMADALISPAVGGTLWAAAAGLIAWCSRQLQHHPDDRRVPLMGVLGAFVFAAQMINFSIPGTGSSGHLGGGLLLAILLGPHAAFLVLASVLAVQALFFMDGGLLALGANIINLGLFPAFVAYPLIYRPLAGQAMNGPRLWLAAILAAVVGLQLGAFGVVVETKLSGLTALPFSAFVLAMLPIHLAIGLAEGLVTAGVVALAARERPDILAFMPANPDTVKGSRRVLVGLLVSAALIGGVLSWFASAHPDGLEWALARVTGQEEVAAPETGLHGTLARVQEKTSFLPDYDFPAAGLATSAGGEPERWPAISAGTTVSGLVGGLLSLALAGLTGLALKMRFRKSQAT
jgi:cobalt/nickel transport system permease protein